MRNLGVCAFMAMALGCASARSSQQPSAAADLAAAPAADGGQVLPFVRDDLPAALSAARARKLPIFLEAWAPW